MKKGLTVLPHRKLWYRPYNLVKKNDVKCIILSNNPYYKEGIPDGLALSTQPSVSGSSLPYYSKNLSLLHTLSFGYSPRNLSLLPLASRGVLLINRNFTVVEGNADYFLNSRQSLLAFEVLRIFSLERPEVPCLFFGRQASELSAAYEGEFHMKIQHPNGFQGKNFTPELFEGEVPFLESNFFNEVNSYLVASGQRPIDWKLPK